MKRIPVIILGAGGVGRALIRQLVHGRKQTAERNNGYFNVVAVTDSKTWQWAAEGLSDAQLLDIVEAKSQGLAVDPAWRHTTPTELTRPSIHGILDTLSETQLGNSILVDVTATDGMESALTRSLNLGHSVVLANKKPLAGPWEQAQGFFNHPRLRHESTVGGGQPIISTMRYLVDVNDPIYRIEGQMSGTMGYICQQLDAGVPFSTAVSQAKAFGYTEPDPRDDLGGMDALRKLLILGRLAGWPLEASQIQIEPLYPASMNSLSVPDFLAQLSQLDEPFRQRTAVAHANGQLLRYVAEVTEAGGWVGLKSISANNGLANSKYISFQTERYNDEPLLVGGKGAGAEMTAAGVVGDMIGLLREAF